MVRKGSPYSMQRWDRLDFIEYLKKTLIPDLIDSGRFSTAEDFETAVFFMDTIPISPYLTGQYPQNPSHTTSVTQRQTRVYRRYEE